MKERSFDRLLALAFLFALCGTPESATAQRALPRDMDGDDFAWFYNKPGVSLAQYFEDERFCARGAWPAERTPYGLAGDVIADALAPGVQGALRDNCMRALEYRRFELRPGRQRAFAQQFAQLSEADVLSYVSAETPTSGVLADSWQNEYMDQSSDVHAQETLALPAPTQRLNQQGNLSFMPRYLHGHRVREFQAGATYDPQMATIVFAMTSPQAEPVGFNKNTLTFLRVDPTNGTVPLTDGDPTFVYLGQWDDARPRDRFQIFQVPAGRYSLWRFLDASVDGTDFCVRTIAFDVRPGEVVYAGRWRIATGQPLHVSAADAVDARSALDQISPDLGGAMQVATYRNGVRLPCLENYIPEFFVPYAIDLPIRPQ